MLQKIHLRAIAIKTAGIKGVSVLIANGMA